MELAEYRLLMEKYSSLTTQIRREAHALHDSVNQTYGQGHPYGFHLDMVVASVWKYGHEVCVAEEDFLQLVFGAYYHDSIEDARLTYNDVVEAACRLMSRQQAVVAAEIVYALTNDKGRTRSERAGENYYRGIRQTPYAPFVKLADRLANTTYSCSQTNSDNLHMKEVYRREMPHFLSAIDAHSDDARYRLPAKMTEALQVLVSGS